MRKLSLILLVWVIFSVYAEDEKALVVGSGEELKRVTVKKIIWKKDEAKVIPIPEVFIGQNGYAFQPPAGTNVSHL